MCQSIAHCLSDALEKLTRLSDSPKIDAEILLSYVLEKDRTYLFTWPDKTLDPEQAVRWQSILSRRLSGEPVAHILGEREFWSLPLYVDNSTLIPRPDTEVLVEQALLFINKSGAKKILDLGTGTGAIALAIAQERPECHVDAVDFSQAAVDLARKNQARHQLHNVTVSFSHWFSHVRDRYDLILANPPYIAEQDEHLDQGDLRFEPRSALVAEDEGMADLRYIIQESSGYLVKGGSVFVEHGWQQANAVRQLFVSNGFQSVATVKDFGGNDRVTFGCR